MSDPQDLGLGELGQRVQALGGPGGEPRLRPYHGAAGAQSNGHSPADEPYEEFRVTPVASHADPAPSPYTSPFSAPSFSSSPLNPPSSASTSARPGFGSAASQSSASRSPWEHTPAPSQQQSSQPGTTQQAAGQQTPPPPSQQSPQEDSDTPKSGLMRAINAVRSALPLVQKLLPMIDGNFATAISALVVPQQQQHRTTAVAPPPPPVVVDLEPFERGLAEVKNSHRELRGQMQEQVASLKRVEDQLEHVREATDRNTLEQQELVEDMRSIGSRVSLFAIVGVVLLVVSLGLNIYFLIQLQHILH